MGARHAHQVDGCEVRVFAVEEPGRRTVGFPPEGVGDVFVAFGEVHLYGHDAALVVDAHEDSEQEIEQDPGCGPQLPGLRVVREADG